MLSVRALIYTIPLFEKHITNNLEDHIHLHKMKRLLSLEFRRQYDKAARVQAKTSRRQVSWDKTLDPNYSTFRFYSAQKARCAESNRPHHKRNVCTENYDRERKRTDASRVPPLDQRLYTSLPPLALQIAVLEAGAHFVVFVTVGCRVIVLVVRAQVYLVLVFVGVG